VVTTSYSLLSLRVNLLSSNYGNGSSVSYSYDSYDRPIAMQWAGFNPSTVVYDARGNV